MKARWTLTSSLSEGKLHWPVFSSVQAEPQQPKIQAARDPWTQALSPWAEGLQVRNCLVFWPIESEPVTMMIMAITDFSFGLDVSKWCFLAKSPQHFKLVCCFFWQMINEAMWSGQRMEVLVSTESCFCCGLPLSLSIDNQIQGICCPVKLHDTLLIN